MPSFTYDYPRPAVTVDCVIFAQQDSPNKPSILLIQRAHPPFEGMWALPGGFVDENETVEQAALRELEEETGVKNVHVHQFYTFSLPGRDPRGWTISIAHWAVVQLADCQVSAGDDAQQAQWFALDQLPALAFDHASIIEKAKQSYFSQI